MCAALVACSEQVAVDGRWTVKSLDGKAVSASEKELFLAFDPQEGRVSACLGINNMMGRYTQDGNKLHISQLASTMMAGLPEDMELESELSAALGKVSRVQISGETMTLSSEDGLVEFVLERSASPAEEESPVDNEESEPASEDGQD